MGVKSSYELEPKWSPDFPSLKYFVTLTKEKINNFDGELSLWRLDPINTSFPGFQTQ